MQLLQRVRHRQALARVPQGTSHRRQAKRWAQQAKRWAQQGGMPPGSFPPDPPRLEISMQEVESHLGSKQESSACEEHEDAWKPRMLAWFLKEHLEELRQLEPAITAKAEGMGLTPQLFMAKLQDLRQLLPAVTIRSLLSLATEDLQDLMCDPSAVACRLVEARTRLPMGLPDEVRLGYLGTDSHFLWDHPELLSSRHWDSFINSLPVASLLGHSDSVTSLAISPDGRRAVSGSEDHTLRVWDLQSHTCIDTLQVHSDWEKWVLSVAITPDGRHAVMAGEDGLWLWDMQAGTSKVSSVQEALGTTALAITPDGHHAVSASFDELCVWELPSLACVATFGMDNGWCLDDYMGGGGVTSLAISPNGRHVVAGNGDNTLQVWVGPAG